MTPEEFKTEAQGIFDQVVAHLRAQGKRSKQAMEHGLYRCLYHHPDGLKCAVGCLIPAADYKPVMEKHEMHEVLEMVAQPLRAKLLRHEKLLGDLQNLHDNILVDGWEGGLLQVAQNHNLMFIGKNITAAIVANKETVNVSSATTS